MSYIGDHVWLMTSRQTDPELWLGGLAEIKEYCEHLNSSLQFINVRVEDAIDESDAGAFVWILVWQLNVNFPVATRERCYSPVNIRENLAR
jgi:hypothetical protein